MNQVETVRVRQMSNADFFRRYGRAGLIGAVGGTGPIDRGIRFAQRNLTADGRRSRWSHVFIFQGDRVDGEPWIIESDIDFSNAQIRNGVQEHRAAKYGDDARYPNLAVLDFGLDDDQVARMLRAALDFIASGTNYAMGGVFKTYLAILRKQLDREKERKETYCSSFIRTLYQHVGIDLAPRIAVRHTSPEHVANTPAPHKRWELVRDP